LTFPDPYHYQRGGTGDHESEQTMRTILFVVILLAYTTSLQAQATTVFKGIPTVKISEGGTERNPESVPREKAVHLECVISKIGDGYYWASRENRMMIRVEKGAFIMYVAIDGSGYVKIIAPGMKRAASLMGETESKFDYV